MRWTLGNYLRRRVAGQVLGLLLALTAHLNPRFFTPPVITSTSNQSMTLVFAGMAQTSVVLTGGIDLSVGSIISMSNSLASTVFVEPDSAFNIILVVLLVLAVSTLAGLVNGLIVVYGRLQPIIVTLGTFSAYRGLSFIVSGGRFVYGLPRDDLFFQILGSAPLGIPLVIWVFGITAVVFHIVYRYTRFGFATRAIGANRRAAALSGIDVDRHRLLVLGLMGFLCGLSGIMTLGFFASADPNLGTGYELLAIAAAIIGGTALSGGRGSVIGAMLGAILIAMIGSRHSSWRWRMRRVASRPSMSGICTSMSTASNGGVAARACSTPCRPSSAKLTSAPSPASSSKATWRLSGLSSTTSRRRPRRRRCGR